MASLPTPAVGWGSGPVAIALLVAVSAAVAVLGPRLVRRRTTGLACCGVLVAAVLVRVPTPGWPPDGWLMVACDVGQGDGLVLNTGVPPHGGRRRRRSRPDGDGRLPVRARRHPDPARGAHPLPRRPRRRPARGPRRPRTWTRSRSAGWPTRPRAWPWYDDAARAAGLAPQEAPYAVTRRIGDVTLEPVWPLPGSPTVGPGDGSTANNASVVLLARIRGVTFFLGGDIEPEGQATLAAMLPGLHVDVLKVPHHGSRYQDVAVPAVARCPARRDLGRGRQRLRPPRGRDRLGPRVHRCASAADRPRRERRGRRGRRTTDGGHQVAVAGYGRPRDVGPWPRRAGSGVGGM